MDRFEEAFQSADVRFAGFRLEEPSYDMLVIEDEGDYLDHLRVQGAGLAYYTALAKQAERNCEELERGYRYRYNEMYSECSDALLRMGKKNNVKDIEAFVQTKYESELKSFWKRLDEAKQQRDNIQAFLEGWKQKSYTLTSMTSLITAGLLTPKQAITEEDVQNNREKIKEILRRRNEQ